MADEPTKDSSNLDQDRRVTTFRVQIDKSLFDISNPTPTGRDLLIKAGKAPPEQFALYLRVRGSQPRRIQLTEVVDLRAPGVERFVTLPLDQTEG